MNLQPLLAWVEARLSERSTYLGAIGLLADFGVQVAPNVSGWIATLGVALVGAILVFTKDHNPTEAATVLVQDVITAQANAAPVANSFSS